MIIFFPNACGIISFFSSVLLRSKEETALLKETSSGAHWRKNAPFSACVTEYA